ncbi:MAG TPA: ECF transporter S component [Candidatus Limnocylindrales bacterium]|jgi:energy-coupling factor transport system substrate-specific component
MSSQPGDRERFFKGFTTVELVIIAVLGIVLGIGGTPMAVIIRFLNTAGGEFGFVAQATVLGWFYLAGVLGGYIVRKPGAATLCEVISGVGQVLSGNPNGVIVLYTTFAQGLGADIGYAIFRYRRWDYASAGLAGALSVPLGFFADAWFFGFPNLDLLLLIAFIVRVISGIVFAWIGVGIITAVARAGVLGGTALDRAVRST